MRHQIFRQFESLPASYRTLLEPGNGLSFYHSLPWYQSLAATALDPGDELLIIGIEDMEGRALCLFPTRTRTADEGTSSLTQTKKLEGFTNVYTVEFGPIYSSCQDDINKTTDYLIETWINIRKDWEEINIRFVKHNKACFNLLFRALKKQGLIVQEYFQYGCYVDTFEPCSSKEFIALLGSNVRKTLARRVRKVERSGQVRYKLFVGQDNLEEAISDYMRIYQSSWKETEAIPDFVPKLIRAAAASDCLRLGIIYLDEAPAATQLSFVSGQHASMFKTAYDENFRDWGLGGVVIFKIMEHLLDVDQVHTIDFGIGDESYKSDWLSHREENWGIMAFNPRTAKGLTKGTVLLGKQKIKNLPFPFLRFKQDA